MNWSKFANCQWMCSIFSIFFFALLSHFASFFLGQGRLAFFKYLPKKWHFLPYQDLQIISAVDWLVLRWFWYWGRFEAARLSEAVENGGHEDTKSNFETCTRLSRIFFPDRSWSFLVEETVDFCFCLLFSFFFFGCCCCCHTSFSPFQPSFFFSPWALFVAIVWELLRNQATLTILKQYILRNV